MYPKKDYFLFVFVETTHNIDGPPGERITATNNVAILLGFYCILNISSRILLATDGPNEDESCNKICIRKVKPYKTCGRSCVAVLS